MTAKTPFGDDTLRDLVRNGLVAAYVLLVPFAISFVAILDVHSTHIERTLLGATVIGPLEVVSILSAAVAIPVLVRRDTYDRFAIGLAGLIGFTVITAIWVLFHPSAEGVARTIRFAGATGVVAIVRWMPVRVYFTSVVWPLTISLLIQAPWALLQTFVWRNGHESGITERFQHVWTHGYGTMDGGYALGAFAALSMAIILGSGAFRRLHPIMWIAVVLGSASIATSFGRQPVLAAIAIAAFYGIGFVVVRQRDYLAAALAAVIPMSIGIARAWVGWSVRASETAAGFQSGRETLLDRAFAVIGENPLTGVGPGRYAPYLPRLGLQEIDYTIVHNVPVLVAAEYGIPIGILFTVWIGLVGLASLMTSFRAMAIFAVVAPYLIFDHPHLVYGYGVASFAIWLASLDFHRRHGTRFRMGRRSEAGSERQVAHAG